MSQIESAGVATGQPALAASPQAKQASQGFDKVKTAANPHAEPERAPIETPKKLSVSTIDPTESKQRLHEVIKALSDRMAAQQKGLQFSVDERLGRQIVTVLNKETGDVIRQIPGEAVLRVANSIEDLKGILFDDVF